MNSSNSISSKNQKKSKSLLLLGTMHSTYPLKYSGQTQSHASTQMHQRHSPPQRKPTKNIKQFQTDHGIFDRQSEKEEQIDRNHRKIQSKQSQ